MVRKGQVSYKNKFIKSVSASLQLRLRGEDVRAQKGLIAFHSVDAPNISITQYLKRINKYAEFPLDCFLVSIIYIDRLLQMNPGFSLNIYNIHRLLIASIVIAVKYTSDFNVKNKTYAKIGGISLKELNYLEKEFLQNIGYSLFIELDLFQLYNQENIYLQSYFDKKSAE